MTTTLKSFIWAGAAVAAVVLAGNDVGFALMAIAAPVYAILLASVFLMCFIVVASISVPIGRKVLDWHEATLTGQHAEILYEEDHLRHAA